MVQSYVSMQVTVSRFKITIMTNSTDIFFTQQLEKLLSENLKSSNLNTLKMTVNTINKIERKTEVYDVATIAMVRKIKAENNSIFELVKNTMIG